MKFTKVQLKFNSSASYTAAHDGTSRHICRFILGLVGSDTEQLRPNDKHDQFKYRFEKYDIFFFLLDLRDFLRTEKRVARIRRIWYACLSEPPLLPALIHDS